MLQHKGAAGAGAATSSSTAGNSDFDDVCTRYAELLTEHTTFAATTIEDLVRPGALAPKTRTTLGDGYIVG